MTTTAVLRRPDDVADDEPSLAERIASLARSELTPILQQIDDGEIYPDRAMRSFG